jgi:hypothetical protein
VPKLGKKIVSGRLLNPGLPILMGIAVLGLALFINPSPASSHIIPKTTAKKSAVNHVIPPPPKAPPPSPPPAVPAAAVSKPTSPTPVNAKTAVQYGTPKAQPVVTPSPSSDVSGLAPATPAPAPAGGSGGGPGTAAPQTTTSYTSLNWAGYMAVHGTFTSVSGSWTATKPTGNSATTTADSTWIGIGGVTSGDLIQVGTQNIITASGQVNTSAFYEILPDVSQPVPGVSVSAGDSLSASITQISSGQWSISITDKTNGQSATFSVAYTSSLSSVEWIEEDPSFANGRFIPFDNFHQASFAAGATNMNGSNVNIANSTAQPVTMVNRAGQIKAAPSVLGVDGASFSVTL